MLKKTITFDDLDGNSITEDFYFNLTKAEMIEMGIGGYQDTLQKILSTEDMPEMLKQIRILVGQAVGKRSEDGRRFIKSPEITEDFIQSEAFSELFTDLVFDTTGLKAQEFFGGLMPKGLAEKAMEQVKAPVGSAQEIHEKMRGTDVPEDAVNWRKPDATILPVNPPKIEEPADPTPWMTEGREPTPAELRSMSKEQMVEVMQRKMNPPV